MSSNEQGMREAPPPGEVLAVDMDGTLLRTDMLYESLATLLRRPWRLFLLLPALLRGKAAFKATLARLADPDVDHLPVNQSLLDWLVRERASGRRLLLVSASNDAVVQRVAARFGIFDFVQGSDDRANLSGTRKHAAVAAQFGAAYTYAGNSRHDLPVWRDCGRAVLVGDVARLRRALPAAVEVAGEFAVPHGGARAWARALRLHQWAKNTLVFVPLLLSGMLAQDAVIATLVTFLVLGLVASATYLVNDLMDLSHDRRHRTKRHRPLASGALSIRAAMVAAPLLAAAAVALLAFLPWRVGVTVALYVALTLAYSMHLKRVPVLDLLLLAFLFTLRIVAGIMAIEAPVTPWLLTFSMFFFFSIAAMKRYEEVGSVAAAGAVEIAGRGYRATDAPFVMTIGLTAGFCSTLVFFIYLVDPGSPARDYGHPELMWSICAILAYWLGRAWLLASRGAMHTDPVLFALRDRVSLALGAITVLISLAARW